MKLPRSRLRANLWLESKDGILFGMGRYLLLKQVEMHGSLKQAAQALNMSYRAAWGKMKQAEDALGQPLIEKHGSNRTGYRLTPFGKAIMDGYIEWVRRVEDFAVRSAREVLDIEVLRYDDTQRSETQQHS